MASADDIPTDAQCCEAFQKCVEMEQAAKTLSPAEKKQGRSTAVKKAVKDGLKEPALVNICDASIMPKYQDKKTKKVTDVDFVTKMLPDLACESLKAKHKGKKPSADEIKTEDGRLRKKLCENMSDTKQSGPKAGAKADSVTNRLTDTAKYTGAHKERFDKSGKGKGLDGREDKADTSGYVGNYKGAGTFDEAK